MGTSRSRRVFLSLFVSLIVWICHEDGLLSRPDALLYHWGLELASLGQQSASPLLLVEVSPTQLRRQEATLLPRLLGALEQLGAQTVVLNFLPANVPSAFYQEAVRYGNVFFGRSLALATDEQETPTLAALPAAAEGLPIQWGIVQLPPTVRGLSRSQFQRFIIAGTSYPALEMAVAAHHPVTPLPFARDSYLVNFRGGPGSLPRVNGEQVLAGELVAELVAGHTVLIGAGAEDLTPGIHTPTSGAQVMSVLEYQGHALDTLLAGRRFSEVGRWFGLFLFFCVAAGSLVVYEWPTLHSLVVRLMTPFITCVGVALVAFFFQLWLPLAGMLLVQLLTTLISAGYRAMLANHALDTIVFLLSASLRDRLRPSAVLATDPWAPVVNMLQQTLDLKRMVFLDRIEGKHHVREVYAFNCSLTDIDERRRDYRRAPYSTALAARAPIRLDLTDRHYLTTTTAETAPEDQYIVPLIYHEHLYGFWAFGVEPAKAAAIRDFTTVVAAYGEQIGKLFHGRQQAEQTYPATGWRVWRTRLFAPQPREESYKALDRIVNRLEGRLTQLETLLHDLHTATMVYDLLGAPLEVNLRMHELLKDEAIAPHELTIVELIARLTHKEVDSARYALRSVLLEGHELALPITLSKGREHYVINIRPLRLQEGVELREGPSPFGVSGVVCELVDRTLLTRLYEIKTHVVDRLATQLRTELATIELSSSLLADGGLPEEDRMQMVDTIQEKVQQSVDLLTESQQYLSSDIYLETVETFPVNVQTVLAEVVETLQPQLEERGIRWEIAQPELMSAVLASPIRIGQVLSSIFLVLLRDTTDHTAIVVTGVENENGIVYVFSNSGFGIPNDHFQEYLSGNGQGAAKELKGLREAMLWVKDWGGTLEVESHVGEGIRATLQLRRFI